MDNSKIFSKVYMWMFIGLAITFLTGSLISNNASLVIDIFSGINYLIIAVLEIGLVIFLSARITKMKPLTAKILFLFYSVLTGVTFSGIFLVYKIESITVIFLITSLIMLVLSLVGYFTKIDLTRIGNLLFIGLIGVIITSIVNIFIGSETIVFITSIISVIIFIGFIAYDVQNIKRMYQLNAMEEDNLAIYGALQLYLDFINIFIDLLRLFGNARD